MLTSAKCALAAATESAEAFTPTTAHGTLRFLQVGVLIGWVHIVNRVIGAGDSLRKTNMILHFFYTSIH